MGKFVSIQKKLQTNVMLLITCMLAMVILIITVINTITLNNNIQNTKANIEMALLAKGRLLAANNSLAMQGMAADNAYSAIQDLVAAALKDDKDIVYAIFMDRTQKPWAYATPAKAGERAGSKEPLTDSISLWASKLMEVGSKRFKQGKEELIEFTGPVLVNEKPAGFIRYGISTAPMQKAIAEATRRGIVSGAQMIFWLLVIGAASLYASGAVLKRLSSRITKPIWSLVKSTEVIAQGNYNTVIQAESNDEIGNLAQFFEQMRVTIKRYTDHLQDIIDEKMQQVNDILNNIDQGLFTVNFDGTVNPEYSKRTGELLQMNDLSRRTIQEIFRLDQKKEQAFLTWLALVVEIHAKQRWKKIVRLAPIRQLELSDTAGAQPRAIELDFQRILDKNNGLSKIMVLARDVTDERRRERDIREQRLRHENEMKTVLGIVNTPPDEMLDFTTDVEARLKRLISTIKLDLQHVEKMRAEFPNGSVYSIKSERINELFCDIHTLKGNAGSYGFELISSIAHDLEDHLEDLREPVEKRRDQTLREMLELLDTQKKLLADIRQKMDQFFGEGEDLAVKIPLARIRSIAEKVKKCSLHAVSGDVRLVLDECLMLSWKQLKDIARKYQKIVQRAARKLGKEIEFIVEQPRMLLPPDALEILDESLVHLTRNAVDHGIEPPEIRSESGKGAGHVTLSYFVKNGGRVISIADDGAGIDVEKISSKGIKLGIISVVQCGRMSEKEKLELMFQPGFSTVDTVGDLSGRGFGLHIVRKNLAAIGASLEIETKIGQGTKFIITVPGGSAVVP